MKHKIHIDVEPASLAHITTICGESLSPTEATNRDLIFVCLEHAIKDDSALYKNKTLYERLGILATLAASRDGASPDGWCPVCMDEDKITLHLMDFLNV